MSCSKCSEPTANLDTIQCYGFCGRTFHFTCISQDNSDYKKSIIGYLQKIANLQWYCNDCVPFTINGLFNGILGAIKENADGANNLMQQINSQFQSQPQSTQTNTQTQNPTQTQPITHTFTHPNSAGTSYAAQTSLNSHSNSNTFTHQNSANTSTVPIRNETSTIQQMVDAMVVEDSSEQERKKRRLSKSGDTQQQLNSNNNNTVPTLDDFAIDLTDVSPSEKVVLESNVPNDSNLREVHLTNFKNNTQVSDVLNYLNSYEFLHPFIGSFKCKKLVRRGTRVENYSFLSFKLSVPDECFKFVIEQINWPKSIKASAFVDKRKSSAQTQAQTVPNSKRDPVNTVRKVNSANQNASKNPPSRKQLNNGQNMISSVPTQKNSMRQKRNTQNQRSTNVNVSPPALPSMNPLCQMLLSQMLLPLFNNTQN